MGLEARVARTRLRSPPSSLLIHASHLLEGRRRLGRSWPVPPGAQAGSLQRGGNTESLPVKTRSALAGWGVLASRPGLTLGL